MTSTDWNNSSNWDDGTVPTSTVDVTIPAGCPNYPVLSGSLGINTATYTYDCKSLTINSGGTVTVSGNPVYNYGVLTVAGTLNVGDDFFLYSGSTVNLSGTIQIGNTNGWFGEAYHNSGSIFNQTGGSYYIESIILSDGSQFNGTGGYTRIYVHDFANNNNITINDPDSYFYNFYVESTANAALYNCTYDLQVNFSLNSNGPLNIGSYIVNATYMDIYSALTINSGGTINVTSNGPYFHTAGSLIMSSGGILNSAGNIQFQTGSAENVSGGDIFIEDNFSDFGNIFTPTGGTVTFDASSTSTIYGPTVFYNLIVNKTISDDSGNQNNFIDKVNTVPETYVVDPKSSAYIKNDMMDNTKATIVYLASGNVNALNNVTIQNGELNLSGLQLTIAEDCYVYGTLTMNNSADVLNLGNDFYDWLEFLPGSTANLTAGTIKLYGWIIPRAGSNFTATTGHTVILKGNSGGGPSNFEPTAVYGNIIVDKNAGQIAYIDNLASQPINVSGTFTMNANTIFEMQNETMNVNGVLTDVGTSEIRVYDVTKDGVSPGSSSIKTSSDQNSLSAAPAPVENGTKGGYLEIDIDFTLNGLMDVGDGNVLLHGIFHIASAGNLNITSGSFIADSPLFAKNWEYIDGHLGLTSGLFEISHNSIQFSATGTSTVSGGIIRSGEAFASIYAGNFQPTGGTVEIVGVGSNTIFCDNGNYFYNLLINRDPAASSTFFDNVTINNNLTVNSGILDLFQFTISVYGGVTINGGELDLRNNSTLLLAGGTTLNVNSGGKISLLAGPEPWKVSRISTGYYGFNVQSGGTIAAKNGVFEYMNTNGINLLSGSLVDPAYSFENCTFQNGQAAGTLMTIENNQTFYAEDAVFPTNTWAGAFNVTKAVNAGMVYFVTATGGFAGESYDNDVNNRIMWTNRSLALKAYMEGPFNGATMNTTLNGILPLSHPFNPALPYFGNPSPDWYYTGAGAVGAIPNVNIVDWTLIEIRDAVNAASATPATSVAKFPAFILNNGNIVSLDGASNLQFSNPIVNNLFVVVYNRNHQGIMNANLIPYSSGSYTYDYTTGAAQVYGGVGGHKELSPGKWGMRSGDGNADGNTNILDKTAVWGLSTQLGKTGYLPSDFNFDRQTNNKDKNDKWVPNLGTGSQVP